MHAALDGKSFFQGLARHWVWTLVFVVVLAVFFGGLLGRIKSGIVAKVPAVGYLPSL